MKKLSTSSLGQGVWGLVEISEKVGLKEAQSLGIQRLL
jgi:hypothetical protein